MTSPLSGLKVGFVKQEFVPEQAVVSRQILESLTSLGATVRVVTGTATTVRGTRALGAPILRPTREYWNGVEILRLPFWPSRDDSSVRRIATYASFSASSTAMGAWALHGLDVALVYGSPITAVAAPMAWTRVLDLPYVLHVQDLWPDSVFATGFLTSRGSSLAEVAMMQFVNSAYRRASAVVAISPGMRRVLMDRGVPSGKVHSVFNWTDEEIFQPMAPIDHNGKVVMYAGSLGLAQDLDTVLTALTHLRTPDVRLALVGTGPAEQLLRDKVARGQLANVDFLGRMTPSQARAEMRRADIHLVTLADEPLFRITIPSKVQSLLASGVPIIVSAPGEAGELVEESGAGVRAAPGDPLALASAIDSMLGKESEELTAMGEAGVDFYRAHCSAASGSAALAEILLRSARSGRR